ncbi:MAG: hypothetical protein NC200_02200 [Candidatus Gastranaerophilales bacterium]|nr:hypothetical protein [Candidatus Gastranaerophilales bacterium]
MRVAVTYQDGEVFQHFGHTEELKVYDIDDGKVVEASVISTNGSGHGAIADVLKQIEANVLICGGIGGCAIGALNEYGIELYAGVQGNTDDAVNLFIAGELPQVKTANCSHHGDHHRGAGHSCGHCHH